MTRDIFDQTNDDLAKLLHITSELAHASHKTGQLRAEVKTQIDKIVSDTQRIGGKLIQEAQAIHSEVDRYLNHPTEALRVKIMQDAMNLKHKMREL